MRFHSSAFLLASLAAAASASIGGGSVNAVHVIHILEGVHPTESRDISSNNPLIQRQDDDSSASADGNECATSVLDYLDTAPTVGPELSSLMAAQLLQHNTCTWTADSSLSEELMEWFTSAAIWAQDSRPELQKLLDECDGNVQPEDVDLMGCSTGGVIVFTTDDDESNTVALETALAEVTGDGDGESAASRVTGTTLAMAAGLATVAFLL